MAKRHRVRVRAVLWCDHRAVAALRKRAALCGASVVRVPRRRRFLSHGFFFFCSFLDVLCRSRCTNGISKRALSSLATSYPWMEPCADAPLLCARTYVCSCVCVWVCVCRPKHRSSLFCFCFALLSCGFFVLPLTFVFPRCSTRTAAHQEGRNEAVDESPCFLFCLSRIPSRHLAVTHHSPVTAFVFSASSLTPSHGVADQPLPTFLERLFIERPQPPSSHLTSASFIRSGAGALLSGDWIKTCRCHPPLPLLASLRSLLPSAALFSREHF